MESLVRYRAWIVMGVVLVVAVAAGVLSGHGGGPRGAALDRPHVNFGSQLRQPAATADLLYTNAWTASGGSETIAVYAGGQRSDRRNGLLVILHRSGQRQKLARVVVHGSGALTLLRPAAPASELDARAETLHFVTANGGTGTFSLSDDAVKLSG